VSGVQEVNTNCYIVRLLFWSVGWRRKTRF